MATATAAVAAVAAADDRARRTLASGGPLTGAAHVTRARLGNGVRLLVEPVPGVASVSIGVWVVVGSRDEPAQHAGVSHFLEHLLFKGTGSRSARDISEQIDGVGGDMNAFTTKESTAFYVRVPVAHVDGAFELLADILTDPLLAEDDVESERSVILEEILLRDDTPDDLVHDLLAEALFPDHPLGADILGSRPSIAAMKAADVRSFFDEQYRNDNLVLVAVGAVEPEAVAAAAERAFHRSGGQPPPRSGPVVPAHRTRVVHRPSEQVHLAFGVPTPAATDPDRYALSIMNHVLGGGVASRLFEEVRERRGLSYSVYSYTSAHEDAGLLGIYAGTAAERAPEAAAVIRQEVERLAAEGITERELELAVGFAEGALALSLEQTSARMSRLATLEIVHGEIWSVDEQMSRYRAVTLDDVARVASTVLDAPWTVAAVGPVDEESVATWV